MGITGKLTKRARELEHATCPNQKNAFINDYLNYLITQTNKQNNQDTVLELKWQKLHNLSS